VKGNRNCVQPPASHLPSLPRTILTVLLVLGEFIAPLQAQATTFTARPISTFDRMPSPLLQTTQVDAGQPAPTIVDAAAAANCVWDGSNSNWTNTLHWSCHAVPGKTDSAEVQTGDVSLPADIGIAQLIMGGGTITGIGNLSVSRNMTWTGGAFNNAPLSVQSLEIPSEANLYIDKPSSKSTQRNVNVAGNTLFADGDVTVGGLWQNAGRLDLQTSGGFRSSLARIDNTATGILLKRSGASSSIIEPFLNNLGRIEIGPKMSLQVNQYAQADGSLVLDGGDFINNAPARIDSGTFIGNGTVSGNLENDGGIVEPGLPVGALHIKGDYLQTIPGELAIEIGGRNDGEHDLLDVLGSAQLGGTLHISLTNGFVPNDGETFVVLQAGSLEYAFDDVSVSGPSNVNFNVNYERGGVTLQAIVQGGPISVPDLVIADSPSATLKLSNFQVLLATETPAHTFNISATAQLSLAVPGFTYSNPITVAVIKDGDLFTYTAQLSTLAIPIAGTVLTLTNAVISNTGLSAQNVSLTMPVALGGLSTSVPQVAITVQGLSFGASGLTVNLPRFGLGDVISITQSTATLSIRDDAQGKQYRLTANGTLSVSLPDNAITAPVNLSLDPTQGSFDLQGTAGNLALNIAGMTLTLTSVSLSKTDLAAGSAILQAPASAGNGSVALTGVSIDSLGLHFGNASINLPEIALANTPTTTIKLQNITGSLNSDATTKSYAIAANANISINVEGFSTSAGLSFDMHKSGADYALTGSIPLLSLPVLSGTLTMQNVIVRNDGLTVPTATLVLTNGASFTVTSVAIGAFGVRFSGGAISVPDLIISDSPTATIKLINFQVDVINETVTHGFNISATAQVSVAVPGFVYSNTIDVSVIKEGSQFTYSAQLPSLVIPVAGTMLTLTNAVIGNTGLSAQNATLAMPSELGGLSTVINQVQINQNGLNFGAGNLNVALPRFGIGEVISITQSTATLSIRNTANGPKFRLTANGQVSVTLPDNAIAAPVNFVIDPALNSFDLQGSVGDLSLNVAGMTLTLGGINLSKAGLAVGSAALNMPAAAGNGSLILNGVSIDALGLHFGSSTLSFPDITLANSPTATLKLLNVSGAINNDVASKSYRLSASTNISVSAEGFNTSAALNFEMRKSGAGYALTGTIPLLSLPVLSGTLTMQNVTVRNDGLTVPTATLMMTDGTSITVTGVSIGAFGVRFSGGAISIPDLVISDSPTGTVKLINFQVNLANETVTHGFNISATAQVSVAVPGFVYSNTVDVAVIKEGNQYTYSAQLPSLVIPVAGTVLTLTNAVIGNTGLSAQNAVLAMPAVLGGFNSTISEVKINQNGLNFGQSGFDLTLPRFGFGEVISVTQSSAHLIISNTAQGRRYQLNANGVMSITLPDNATTSNVSFAMLPSINALNDFDLQGSIGGLSFNLAGITLTLNSATLSKSGLISGVATLRLPPELGGGQLGLNNVSIGSFGLRLGAATFALPDIVISNAPTSTIKLLGVNAGLQTDLANTRYVLTATSALSLAVPGYTNNIPFAFNMQKSGPAYALSGTLPALVLPVAGTTLTMTNLSLSNDGFAADNAVLHMPESLGGQTTTITNTRITKRGLTFAQGDANLTLPRFGFGDVISVTQSTATLGISNTASGPQFSFQGASVVSVTLPDNAFSSNFNFTLSPANAPGDFSLRGFVGQIPLSVAGITLTLSNTVMTKDGLSPENTRLELPPSLGGATVNLGGVSIGSFGLRLGSGAFNLPDIVIGADVTDTNAVSNVAALQQTLIRASRVGRSTRNPQRRANFGGRPLQAPATPFGPNAINGLSAASVTTPTLALRGITATLAVDGGTHSYVLSANSALEVNLPGNTIQTSQQFTLNKVGHDYALSGTLPVLGLNIAGTALTLTNMSLSRTGFTAQNATLRMPDSLGGATATITNTRITPSGLDFGSANFSTRLPTFGFAGVVTFTNNTASLGISNTALGPQFLLTTTAQMSITLGDDVRIDRPITLTLDPDGAHGVGLGGSVGELTFNLAGMTVTMRSAQVNSNGIAAATTVITMPVSLGGTVATLSNAAITRNGLSLGGAQFKLPDIVFGNSPTNTIALRDINAALVPGRNYAFSASATLSATLPNNVISKTLAFSMSKLNGSFTLSGSLPSLQLNLGISTTLVMTNIQLNNDGFAVSTATLNLPPDLGTSVVVTNVTITSAGLRIGGADARFAVPVINFGSNSSPIKVISPTVGLQIVGNDYAMQGSGYLSVSLPSNTQEISVALSIKNGQFSTTLSSLRLNVAGVTMTLQQIAVNNAGLSAGSAVITLPANLGNAVSTINGVVIDKNGLRFNNGKLQVPTISLSDQVKLINVLADVTSSNGRYSLSATGNLSLTLPANTQSIPLSFGIDPTGNLSGMVGRIVLNVAGSTLTMTQATLNNNGLEVSAATMQLPANLGNAVGTITGVRIDKTGLKFSQAQVTLPDVKFGDGSTLKVMHPSATLNLQGNGFGLGLAGQMVVSLPQNAQTVNITATINSSGQFSAALSQLNLQIANATLALSNISIDNSGLDAAQAQLNLPPNLGGTQGSLTHVKITSSGLSIAGAGVSVPIPSFKIGGDGFMVTNASAKIAIAANASFKITLEGTVAIAVPGSSATSHAAVTLDRDGRISGQISSFTMSAAGMTIGISGASISNEGTFNAVSATLTLPQGFGGAGVTVNGLVISKASGLQISGGGFTLPPINAGAFGIQNAHGSFALEGSQYIISGGGQFGQPGTPNRPGCAIAVDFVIAVDAAGQTILTMRKPSESTQLAAQANSTPLSASDTFAPASTLATNGLQLRSAHVALTGCRIPIGSTGADITGIDGSITLGPTRTHIHYAMTVAAGHLDPIGDIVTANASADLNTNPFEIAVNGTLNVFIFQVASANMTIRQNSFSSTLNIDLIVAHGSLSFNAWSDWRGFHMTGSAVLTVGVPRGSIWQGCIPFVGCINIPPNDWILGNIGFQAGEFTNGAWGFKGTVVVLGYQAGIFIDSQGHFTVGNVDGYQLVTPTAVSAARTAALNGKNLNANSPERAAALAVCPKGVGVMCQRGLDAITFVPDQTGALGDAIVTVPVTRTNDVIFALTRQGSGPTLTLVMPDGKPVSPSTLPASVQYSSTVSGTETQETYIVSAADVGNWKARLNGSAFAKAYVFSAIGNTPAPVVSSLSTIRTSADGADMKWNVNASAPITMSVFANNAAAITTTHVITQNGKQSNLALPNYSGGALVTGLRTLTGSSAQSTKLDTTQLRSGSYRVWVEADDGRNPPARSYSPDTLTVDHSATWPNTWAAKIKAQTGYRTVDLTWEALPHTDVTGYMVQIDFPNGVTQVISTGTFLSATLTSLDPGVSYGVNVVALDEVGGHKVTSQRIEVVPSTAPFEVSVGGAVSVDAGNSAIATVTLSTDLDPYPEQVSLSTGTLPDGIGVDLDSVITPVKGGIKAQVIINASSSLASGSYTVPLIATGGGVVRVVNLSVQVNAAALNIDAPTSVQMGAGEGIAVQVSVSHASCGGIVPCSPVLFSLANVPDGLIWALSQYSALPGQPATLWLTDTALLTGGAQTLQLQVEDADGKVAARTLTVNVTKPDFVMQLDEVNDIAGSLPSLGQSITREIKLSSVNQWNEQVVLSIDPSELPEGVTAMFLDGEQTPQAEISVEPNATVVLQVQTAPKAKAVSFNVFIVGTSGDHKHMIGIPFSMGASSSWTTYLPWLGPGTKQ